MTAPGLAAVRFGWAWVIGAVLGAVYGFLRPLRPRFTVPADALFVAAAIWGWLILAFDICRGDPRPGYSAGMLGGLLGLRKDPRTPVAAALPSFLALTGGNLPIDRAAL